MKMFLRFILKFLILIAATLLVFPMLVLLVDPDNHDTLFKLISLD